MLVAKSKAMTVEEKQKHTTDFVKELKSMPIAINTGEANQQHYEVPDEFFQLVLGPHLKYSSCYWPTPTSTMAESEIAMLEMYCERAELKDGMTVLDVGWFEMILRV